MWLLLVGLLLCVFLCSMLSTVAWGLGFDGEVEIFGSSLYISQDKYQEPIITMTSMKYIQMGR